MTLLAALVRRNYQFRLIRGLWIITAVCTRLYAQFAWW